MEHVVAKHLMDQLEQEEHERLQAIAMAWQAYRGKLPEPLTVKKGQPNDNVKVNPAKLIVEKGISFLFGDDVGFEIDESGETEAEKWLKQCWEANRKMTKLHTLGQNGAICGLAAVKIVRANPYPRIVVLDPATLRVFWERDDIEDVYLYRIQYSDIDRRTGQAITVRQDIRRGDDRTHWMIVDSYCEVGSKAWITTNEEHWPFAWSPVITCQNLPMANAFWGCGDLEDGLVELNKAINFSLSNTNRILRFHAHPKTVATGIQAKQLEVSVDGVICLPNAESDLKNLEMQSDLTSSLAFHQRLKEALHEESRVPEVATGKVENIGPLSGVALEILYQPLVEKTKTKRMLYGELFKDLNRRLLDLGGFGAEFMVKNIWPKMLPVNQVEEREVLLIDEQLGASRDTLLQKANYDPVVEAQKRAHERARATELGNQLLTAFDRGQLNDKDDEE